MLAPRMIRIARTTGQITRPFSITSIRTNSSNNNNPKDNGESKRYAEDHRVNQKTKPLNQFVPNTTSTMTGDYPNVGQRTAPPEMLNSVDPGYRPADPYPGRVEHFTGGRQETGAQKPELGVGEMEGITFRVEPLKRKNEDVATMRARLLCMFSPVTFPLPSCPTKKRMLINNTDQSRKRGILESDLLLSTFADAYLGKMTAPQLEEYDSFLDENDWDIYYWATQDPPAEAAATDGKLADQQVDSSSQRPEQDTVTETWKRTGARSGEWAQTHGAFKAAYRPVPSRWTDSETLRLLRQHVQDKSASGFQSAKNKKTGGSGGGLGRMPDVKTF